MISLDFVLESSGARLAGAAPAPAGFTGVSIDTRTMEAGGLFVALAGSRTDGHDHLGAARKAGAAGALVDRVVQSEPLLPQLVAGDCIAALADMAAAWRRRFKLAVAAVTGTNGKTTVKEMAAGIMRRFLGSGFVVSTRGNLNNHLGVPLTLLRIGIEHKCAIIEMGMNAPGEIASLCRLAAPNVALVNNAMRGHLEPVGTVGDVARCKGEVFSGLSADGVAVVNMDDPHAELWSGMAGGRRALRFSSCEAGADIRLEEGGGQPLMYIEGRGPYPLELRIGGAHNRMNALAAAGLCAAMGADDASVVAGLADFVGTPRRMQVRQGVGRMTLIDDTYNANPDSALEAIRTLRERPEPCRILVLGDMLELGEEAAAMHAEVGAEARGLRVYTVGELSRHAAEAAGGEHFDRKTDLVERLRTDAAEGTAVLVKGSRGSAMNEVVDALLADGKGS